MISQRIAPRCIDFVINSKHLMFHLRDQQLHLAHVLLMTIKWTFGPHDRRASFDAMASNACDTATCPASVKNPREHSPTRKKKGEIVSIKARAVYHKCVTGPILLPGPTNLWALHLPAPSLQHGATWAPAWTCVALATCPRRVGSRDSATWAHAALPRGLTQLCHVALPAMSHPRGPTGHVSSVRHLSSAGPMKIKPLFLHLKIN